MPRTPFSDLLQILLGSLIAIPIIFLPGYGIAWAFNLLRFRQRSFIGRSCLAAPIAIGVLPILIHLTYRFTSVYVSMALVGVFAIVGLIAMFQSRQRVTWPSKALVAIIGIWILLATFSLVDLDSGGRLYNSSLVWDHTIRSNVVSAMSHTDRLPLTSFLYFPGHTVVLRYHYFSYFFPSFIQRLSFGLMSSNCALYAYIVWTGIAVLGAIAAFVYLFLERRNDKAVLTAWVIAAIGGLQVIPFLLTIVSRVIAGQARIIPIPSLIFWNRDGQGTSLLDSLLWVPNHVSALVALLMGGLVLWDARGRSGRERTIALILSGTMFASSVGLSVYVCAVFAVFLGTLAIYLFRNHRHDSFAILTAGAVSGLLALPFLREIAGTPQGTQVFAVTIRQLYWVQNLIERWHINSPVAKVSLFIAGLPVFYIVDMGLLIAIGWWALRDKWTAKGEFRPQHKLMLYIVVLGFLLCSCVRSFPVNDFGARGLLPAQFALLLFATEFFLTKSNDQSIATRRRWQLAIVLATIGVISSVTELLLLRSYEPLSDAGLAGRTFVLTPWADTGVHNAHLRAAYDWVRNNTPSDAVVQQNPIVLQEVALGLYSERRTALYGSGYIVLPTPKEREEFYAYRKIVFEMFQAGVNFPRVVELCGQSRIDYIVVEDVDDAWQDPSSFVWKQEPVFASSVVRVFDCRMALKR